MGKSRFSGSSPLQAEPGFARQFEYHPEHVFGALVPKIIDASGLPKRKVAGVYVFKATDLLASPHTVIGIGIPNAYVLMPNEDGSGHDKFSAYSVHRKPAEVVTSAKSHELFQAGIQLVLQDTPEAAVVALRKASAQLAAEKRTFKTCVHAIMTMMEMAGFTSGDTKLSSHTFPDHMLMGLLRNGLQFGDTDVKFAFARTGKSDCAETHARRVFRAELRAIPRHVMKNLEAKARAGSKVGAGLFWLLSRPALGWAIVTAAFMFLSISSFWLWGAPLVLTVVYAVQWMQGEAKESPAQPIAPGLPRGPQYESVNVSVSMPAALGMMLRWVWGSHALYSCSTERVDITKHLTGQLEAFPQKNPNFATRLKKKYLFNKWVIWAVRKLLCPKFQPAGTVDERDLLNMLRTHTEESPNKYNLVVTGDPDAAKDRRKWRTTIARISVGMKLIDWILSKHVLVTGYAQFVPFCGELWKGLNGCVYVNGNSGTYQPDDECLLEMVRFLQEVFPNVTFVIVMRNGTEYAPLRLVTVTG